ncbi:MAG: MMPL family transporter, partial [Clostridia bacterium]|nr:MMPL family transporter [Clostridia bacterium]
MNANFMKSKKYIVLAVFLLASVLSVWLIGKVAINYNISDYLDENTETKISLSIIEDQFGKTADIQVMIKDISVESAKEVRDTISAIENILVVNFDEHSENYYKDGCALFVALVDGDEYSDTANAVLEEIKTALDTHFEGKTNYAGAVVHNRLLREAIQKEIVLILAISLCLVVAIMLIMAKSWIEPFLLLVPSGIAVLLNMGTNAMFKEISYITNAVSAILQLALSVDYSIVLLHGYRKAKESEADSEKAMLCAIKNVIKPVSASALTTMAGLLALLFMTMTIGFDIGIVLMKGIVISAVTSLTLLPAFLLLFEKLMDKTAKRELVLGGKKLCAFALKGAKVVVPTALALIIACGALQFGNSYSFTETGNVNRVIPETFGSNSTVIVVYPNGEGSFDKENLLAQKLRAFKTARGKAALKSYTAYSTTVRELYDIEAAAKKLSISTSDVEMLFAMYHLYSNSSAVKLNAFDFVEYTVALMENDPEAAGFASAELVKTLQTLLVIEEIMGESHTAEQLHTLSTTGVMEEVDLSLFAIKHMYGLYFYDTLADDTVDLKTMLDYIIASKDNEILSTMLDDETVSNLERLSEGIDLLNTVMVSSYTE